MNILIYALFPCLLLLAGCSSQLPAPIQHHYTKSSKRQSNSGQNPQNHTLVQNKHELEPMAKSDEFVDNNLKTIFHQVRDNENLETIANRYELSKEELANCNNLPINSNLSVGQLLRIKVPSDKLDKFNSDTPLTATTKTEPLVVRDSKNLIWPVNGKILSRFGENVDGKIKVGININAPEGSSIKSIGDGIVLNATRNKDFGNFAIVKLNNSNVSVAYAYMKELSLKKGQSVKKGQVIGSVGMSGKATKPQLYLAIKEGKKAIDPEKYIPH